jgi:hypothetical protein
MMLTTNMCLPDSVGEDLRSYFLRNSSSLIYDTTMCSKNTSVVVLDLMWANVDYQGDSCGQFTTF